MKIILTLLLFLPTLLFAQGVVGDMLNSPVMNKYEAEIISKASNAESVQGALEILLEHSQKSWAGAPLLFNIANAYYRLNQYAKSEEFYKKALEKQRFFMCYKNLAVAQDSLGKREVARENFLKALAISGNSDTACLMWLADYYSNNGDFSSALAMCNQLLLFAPENKQACYTKAYLLLKLEMFAEAEKYAIANYQKTADNRYLKIAAKSALAKGDKHSAIASLEILNSTSNASKSEIELLADLYFSLSVFEKSAELYASVGSEMKLENLAKACLNVGDLKTAMLATQRIKDVQKRSSILGVVFARQGNFKASQLELEKALKLNNSDFVAVQTLADVYSKLGKYAEASALYARMLANPKYCETARYGLLNIALAQKRYTEALNLALEIDNLHPSQSIKNLKLKLQEYLNELEKSTQ